MRSFIHRRAVRLINQIHSGETPCIGNMFLLERNKTKYASFIVKLHQKNVKLQQNTDIIILVLDHARHVTVLMKSVDECQFLHSTSDVTTRAPKPNLGIFHPFKKRPLPGVLSPSASVYPGMNLTII